MEFGIMVIHKHSYRYASKIASMVLVSTFQSVLLKK